ncbi:MAG: hypothetical protein ACR2MX_13330 [Cyclobacteriaceae bacterium]
MKKPVSTYLLLLIVLCSAGPSMSQDRGRIISEDQIIIFDPSTNTFDIQNVNRPLGEVGETIDVTEEHRSTFEANIGFNSRALTTALVASSVGEILSVPTELNRKGQIMYKQGDSFVLIDYRKSQLSSDLGKCSCVSFTIKNKHAIKLQPTACDWKPSCN